MRGRLHHEAPACCGGGLVLYCISLRNDRFSDKPVPGKCNEAAGINDRLPGTRQRDDGKALA